MNKSKILTVLISILCLSFILIFFAISKVVSASQLDNIEDFYSVKKLNKVVSASQLDNIEDFYSVKKLNKEAGSSKHAIAPSPNKPQIIKEEILEEDTQEAGSSKHTIAPSPAFFFNINHTHIKSLSAGILKTKDSVMIKFSGQANLLDLKKNAWAESYFNVGKFKIIDPHFEAGIMSKLYPHTGRMHFFAGLNSGYFAPPHSFNIKIQIFSDNYKDLKDKASGFVAFYYTYAMADLINKEDLAVFYLGWYSPSVNLASTYEEIKNEIISLDRNKDNLIVGLNYFLSRYSDWSYTLETSLSNVSLSVNRGW